MPREQQIMIAVKKFSRDWIIDTEKHEIRRNIGIFKNSLS